MVVSAPHAPVHPVRGRGSGARERAVPGDEPGVQPDDGAGECRVPAVWAKGCEWRRPGGSKAGGGGPPP